MIKKIMSKTSFFVFSMIMVFLFSDQTNATRSTIMANMYGQKGSKYITINLDVNELSPAKVRLYLRDAAGLCGIPKIQKINGSYMVTKFKLPCTVDRLIDVSFDYSKNRDTNYWDRYFRYFDLLDIYCRIRSINRIEEEAGDEINIKHAVELYEEKKSLAINAYKILGRQLPLIIYF